MPESSPTPKAENLTWHAGQITTAHRQAALGQRGATVWFTGLSGSGKSTVAVAVEAALHARGRHAYRLDGDNVRQGLCANLGFSPADRDENIRRIGETAKLLADAGLICLCSFVSPYQAARDGVRASHERGLGEVAAAIAFFEVFVDVPVDVAAARDPKGLYAKAQRGEIKDFTGVSAPFEAPPTPELHLPTHEFSLDESVAAVLRMLETAGVIPPTKNEPLP